MTDNNASTRRLQAQSLNHADQHGEPWIPDEVELLLEPASAADLAALLGRTVYAVTSARHLLAKGQPIGGGNPRSPPASRQATPWASDDPRWG